MPPNASDASQPGRAGRGHHAARLACELPSPGCACLQRLRQPAAEVLLGGSEVVGAAEVMGAAEVVVRTEAQMNLQVWRDAAFRINVGFWLSRD